jgi:hypothetical protein
LGIDVRGPREARYDRAVRLSELVRTSNAVQATTGRLEKIERLASLLTQTPVEEVEIAVAYLSGAPRQGRIGLGGAAISPARAVSAADASSLELREVDGTFARIAAARGAGVARERRQLLRDLLARATRDEQEFLIRLLFGELRQGALEGVMVEAVARAAKTPAAGVRRAAMMAGDLAQAARAALTEGALSGRPGVAVRARQALSHGQDRGGGGHVPESSKSLAGAQGKGSLTSSNRTPSDRRPAGAQREAYGRARAAACTA